MNGGLTFIVDRAALGGPDAQPPLAVTVPAGAQAAAAVQREGRILQGLSGLALGELRQTVPQHVETMSVDDRPVLVATALPGRPMSAARSAPSTPRHQRVRRDFDLAGAWLAEFWAATTDGSGPVTWGAEVADAVRAAPGFGRLDERPPDAAAMLFPADAHHVELGGPWRVLLQAQEAGIRLHGEGRKRRRVRDVRLRRLLDPEPLGEIAENGLGDARALRRILDLDDVDHGRPVTRMPAWPL